MKKERRIELTGQMLYRSRRNEILPSHKDGLDAILSLWEFAKYTDATTALRMKVARRPDGKKKQSIQHHPWRGTQKELMKGDK